MELALSLYRLGRSSLVNSYLIEEEAGLTIIDAGLPGHWKDLGRELAAMGRSVDDVRALLLTHSDVDHVGFAERLRRDHMVPVYVGEADAVEARVRSKPPAARDPKRVWPLVIPRGRWPITCPGWRRSSVGDAMATRSVTTGIVGPALGPFTVDPVRALASLAALDGLTARWVLPGHGDPWTGGLPEALGIIRGRRQD